MVKYDFLKFSEKYSLKSIAILKIWYIFAMSLAEKAYGKYSEIINNNY